MRCLIPRLTLVEISLLPPGILKPRSVRSHYLRIQPSPATLKGLAMHFPAPAQSKKKC